MTNFNYGTSDNAGKSDNVYNRFVGGDNVFVCRDAL